MIDATELIEALQAYRKRLQDGGFPAKAKAVEHCIKLVKRLAKG
ncbi:hypothetical protein [uncultured Rhodoferax sp.]|nr:hypothetical protein [uncultured Rhodoferax sp.]